jgi:MFS family permease
MASAAERGEESLLYGYSGRLFATFMVITLTGSVGRLALSPLLPTIIEDLGISRSAAGTGLTAMWAFTAVTQFPGGRLSDELSRKTILVAGLTANVIGFSLLATVGSYVGFVLATAVVGSGTGLFLPAKYLTLTDLFVERRGRAFGINSAAAELGGIVAAGAAVAVLALGSWRLAFVPVVAILTAGVVAIHLWTNGPYRAARVNMDVRGTARRLLGADELRRLLIVFALFSLVWQGVTSFLPAFLQAEKGFSGALASNVFAELFVVAAVVTPLAGGLGDRFGHVRVGVLTPVFATVGLAMLLALDTLLAVIAGIAVLAAGLGSFWPVMSAYLMEVLPDRDMGGDFGATRAVFMGIGSFGPAYVGVAADFASYTAAFGGFVACLLFCTALILRIERD